MHYKDGTPAELNDEVRGKPFNTPHEVQGVVERLNAQGGTCNLVVSFARVSTPGLFARRRVELAYDYGDCSQFELVRRNPES